MAILASECLQWIPTSLGEEAQDPGIHILNAAGEQLVMMHEWRWLERESTVSFVASQNYASLPSDFRALLAVEGANSFDQTGQGTLEFMVLLKSSNYQSGRFYTVTVTYRVASNIPTPVLRIDPTPTANETDVFNIAYLAGWTELSSDNSAVVIPEWIKPLYRQLVIAYARGYDEDDEARAFPAGQLIEEHLAVIKRGVTFMNAVDRDALINPSQGRVRYGWIQTGNRVYGAGSGYGYLRNQVGAPGGL